MCASVVLVTKYNHRDLLKSWCECSDTPGLAADKCVKILLMICDTTDPAHPLKWFEN